MATSTQQTGTAVVGYFATGNEAHRAINALIDEGFLPSEIGAAFHVGEGSAAADRTPERQANVGGSLRSELGTTNPSGEAQASSFGAPGSDTTPVQPGAMGGGAGTIFSGAGRPGPISGSGLANSGLPSELESSLPHSSSSGEARAIPSSAGSTHATHRHESWGDKLKHIFTSDKRDSDDVSSAGSKGPATKESQKFGTGEGHMVLNESSGGFRYSRPAFESSFTGYGVPPEHARSLSHRLGRGGAVLMVHAGSRGTEAERILEANGGEVRFSAGSPDTTGVDDGNVEVFGTVHRDYPGYLK